MSVPTTMLKKASQHQQQLPNKPQNTTQTKNTSWSSTARKS